MPSPINLETVMPNNLSVIILTHNSQNSLEKTLNSVSWADEIIIIDQFSSDNTLSIAKKFTTHIFQNKSESFSQRRNLGLQKSTNPWVLYLDSDEVVSQALKQEIIKHIGNNQPASFSISRQNYFLGQKMYPDQVHRFFHKERLKTWRGDVHESPQFIGDLLMLKHPIIHHTHTDISSMLEKTNKWSNIEAKLRHDAKHPPVKAWRVMRIAFTEAFHQIVHKKIYRYGKKGWIEGMFQVIDKMIVYIKLWELQQT